MDRRTFAMLASAVSIWPAMLKDAVAQDRAGTKDGPIVLYCDLAIDSAREQEILDHYDKDFKPAAEMVYGYIELKKLKMRRLMQGGPAPAHGVNYRFRLTYESEEKRRKWTSSPIHKQAWPYSTAVTRFC